MEEVVLGMREIVGAVCATQPIRGLLATIGRVPAGRRFLTNLNPRGGVYDTLEGAWKAAKQLRLHGHEHPETVQRNAANASTVLPSDYALLYWLNQIPGDIRLFDYGGSMGNVFYSCARYVDTKNRSLQWTVYDLPAIIEMGRDFVARRTGPTPRFTTSLRDAADANVLLVCGTIHYWEGNTENFLEQFPKFPAHIFINRSPFYDDKEAIISLQASMNFAFPVIIKSSQELIQALESKGYELVDRWKAAEYGHDMPFFPNQTVRSYSGFYFRLKAN